MDVFQVSSQRVKELRNKLESWYRQWEKNMNMKMNKIKPKSEWFIQRVLIWEPPLWSSLLLIWELGVHGNVVGRGIMLQAARM
jgi:hypothetical protein